MARVVVVGVNAAPAMVALVDLALIGCRLAVVTVRRYFVHAGLAPRRALLVALCGALIAAPAGQQNARSTPRAPVTIKSR